MDTIASTGLGAVRLEGNTIETKILVEDQRREAGKEKDSISKP